MATWTVSRNNFIPDMGGPEQRGRLAFLLLKDLLQGATIWSCLGSGTGSISAGSTSTFDESTPTTTPGSGNDVLPTYAEVIAGTASVESTGEVYRDAWICLRNQEGVEIVLQTGNDAGYRYSLDCYVSQSGGYTNAMAHSATARIGGVGGPGDEEEIAAGNYYDKDPAGAAMHYKSVAVSDDGNSFYLFSNYDADGNFLFAFVKLEDVDAADVVPTYLPYWFMMAGSSTDRGSYRGFTMNANHARGIHPSAGLLGYCPVDHYTPEYTWDYVSPSPFTGKYQRMELLCGRSGAANGHIRGKIPELYRVSTLRATGTIADDGLVILDDYMLPWGSTTEPLL